MRRLKFVFMSFVMVIYLLSSSASSSATGYSTGKAIIPYYFSSNECWSTYYVTNITDDPINVTISFYDQKGNLLTDDNNINTGKIVVPYVSVPNFDDQNTDSTVTFTLNAHCSTPIDIRFQPIANFGHGVIEWQQAGSTLKGLVCYGMQFELNYDIRIDHTIEINGGLPF